MVVAGVGPERVFVQVVDVDVAAGREISFGKSLAEGLADRQDDIRGAVEAGSQAVASSIESLPSPPGWRLGEVSAKFGITLTAEAGVIVSRASAGATFEVSVKFTRA
jgi:Trypsin-co-occurring domain 1